MIAITGASGEIGGRLAQYCFNHNIPVRLLVRNIDPRLARFSNAEIRRVDVNNFEELKTSLLGCKALINCAIDKSNAEDEAGLIERNKKFFINLLEASTQSGIEKFVELSSIAVLPPRITKSVLQNEFDYCSGSEYADWYANVKIATEQIALEYKDKIDLTIIRPGMVYGPYMHWSKLVFLRTMFNRHVLPAGNTLCHAVYVDDLVDLMLFAADKRNVLPTLIYAVNPEPITWQQYFDYHSTGAGYSSAFMMNETEIRQLSNVGGDVLRKPGFKRSVIDFARKVIANLPQGIKKMVIVRKVIFKLKAMNYGLLNYESYINPPKVKKLPYFMPNRFETELFLTDTAIPADKDGTAHGFVYKTGIKGGAKQAANWWKFRI